MKNIYLLIGKSGVGKTTLITELIRRHPEWRQVESYTDRPKRYEDEVGHIFLTPEEFTRLMKEKGMVTYTEFCGHRYGTTSDVVDASDFYAIDAFGINLLKRSYKGRRGIKVIGLVADDETLRAHMHLRGDKEQDIEKRIEHDKDAFDGFTSLCDFVYRMPCGGGYDAADVVEKYIDYCESNTPTVRIYQINPLLDRNRVCFLGAEALRRESGDGVARIDLSIYDKVWEGDPGNLSLEEIFVMFNRHDRPNADKMRSLSVSDIVEILHNEDTDRNGRWFCDSLDWKKVEECSYLK